MQAVLFTFNISFVLIRTNFNNKVHSLKFSIVNLNLILDFALQEVHLRPCCKGSLMVASLVGHYTHEGSGRVRARRRDRAGAGQAPAAGSRRRPFGTTPPSQHCMAAPALVATA